MISIKPSLSPPKQHEKATTNRISEEDEFLLEESKLETM